METIIGAGLAGLIAAAAWPQARLHEAAPGPAAQHRALLRFRSDSVSRLTGVEFRKVGVRKSIFSGGALRGPDIDVANAYSQKVLGRIGAERSIWNLAPVDRWVAPDTLYEQLVESAKGRIEWGRVVRVPGVNCVSTAPLPVALKWYGIETKLEFARAPIVVSRFRVSNTDAYQTIYFPDPDTSVYRASLTGDMLIVEHVVGGDSINADEMEQVFAAFSLTGELEELGVVQQQFGKIAPVRDDAARKRALFNLTHEHGLFSLGRFATWRNILLDDVVDDIAVIKRLLRAGASGYDLQRASAS